MSFVRSGSESGGPPDGNGFAAAIVVVGGFVVGADGPFDFEAGAGFVAEVGGDVEEFDGLAFFGGCDGLWGIRHDEEQI